MVSLQVLDFFKATHGPYWYEQDGIMTYKQQLGVNRKNMRKTAVESSLSWKFSNADDVRDNWAQTIQEEEITMEYFNHHVGGIFTKYASIDFHSKPSVLQTLNLVVEDTSIPEHTGHCVYVITRNGKVMKIGGTRTGVKSRFGSYCCGQKVSGFKGKGGKVLAGRQSETNGYIYYTIEKDLMTTGAVWEFYTWQMDETIVRGMVLGERVEYKRPAFPYYICEARAMEVFQELAGHIPQLCDNSDPNHRSGKAKKASKKRMRE